MPLTLRTQGGPALALAAAIFAASGARGDQAEDRYAAAANAYAEKQWTLAAGQFRDFLDKHPGHPKSAASLFFLAESQLRAGQFDAAAESYRQYLEKAPGGEYARPALFRSGEAAWFQRKFDEAKTVLQDFLAKYPNDPFNAYVLNYLGNIALEENDAASAENLFRRALSDYPGSPVQDGCRLALGRALEKLGQNEEAQALYRAVADTAGSAAAADAQFALGSLLYAQGEFAEAAKSFERFETDFAASPRQPAARLASAWALIRLGRHTEAQSRLESIRSDPQIGTEARYWLGAIQLFRKDWQAAAECFLEAAEHDPRHPLAGEMRLEAADALAQDGRLDRAAGVLDELLQAKPEASIGGQAALAKAKIFERLSQRKAALAAYQEVFDRYASTPACPEALMAAALLHERLAAEEPESRRQHLEAAVALYRRLVDAHPKSLQGDRALYNQAWAMIGLGRKAEAMPLFEQVCREHPQSRYWGHAALSLVQEALEAGDYARAEPLAKELLNRPPDPAILDRALYLSGQVAMAEEDWVEARRAFDRLSAECQSSPLRLWAEFSAAEAAFRQPDYTAAGERFRGLARKTESGEHPLTPTIRLRIAQLQAHDRLWGDAAETARRVKEEFPDFPEQYEADYVIGLCKSSQADFAGAREAYEAVLRSPQGSRSETAAKAQYMIADSYLRQRNYEQALREYLRLENRYAYPELQAAAVFQAARCAEKLGRWTEVIDLYARLLKTYPRTSHAPEAAERLELARSQAAPSGV